MLNPTQKHFSSVSRHFRENMPVEFRFTRLPGVLSCQRRGAPLTGSAPAPACHTGRLCFRPSRRGPMSILEPENFEPWFVCCGSHLVSLEGERRGHLVF